MEAREALEVAGRLQDLGVIVRSPELVDAAKRRQECFDRGGNRAMRRKAARAQRRKARSG